MTIEKDLVGKKFNKLKIIEYHHTSNHGHKYYKCECDCGNITITCGFMIKRGKIKSCGCLRRENIIKLKTTHGLSKERLYGVWADIKARCYNKNDNAYCSYGGRGIIMCDEWKNNYKSFHDWAINNGYNDKLPKMQLTIDRIDVNGNYEPSNCRWVDIKTQGNNRRTNIYAEYNGDTKTLTQWAEHFGYNDVTFSMVYKKVGSIENLLEYFKARGNAKRYDKNSCQIVEYKGELKPLKEWAKQFNIGYKLLAMRINRMGWSLEKSLLTPIRKNHQIEYNGNILDLHAIARLNNIHPNSLKYQWKKNNYDIYKALEHFKGEECKKNLSKV